MRRKNKIQNTYCVHIKKFWKNSANVCKALFKRLHRHLPLLARVSHAANLQKNCHISSSNIAQRFLINRLYDEKKAQRIFPYNCIYVFQRRITFAGQ
jgi:hypothetical protein